MKPHRLSHRTFIKTMIDKMIVRLAMVKLRIVWIAALTATLTLVGCDKSSNSGSDSASNDSSQASTSSTGKEGDDGGSANSAACKTTSYNILVRGDFVGSGTASISATSVQISAQVTDSTGAGGTLTATLPVVNQRFAGTGTVLGQLVTINGRVDPADNAASPASVLRSPRLVGTFSTVGGRFGRIAGQAGASKKTDS